MPTLYGQLFTKQDMFFPLTHKVGDVSHKDMDEIETFTEKQTLEGKILVLDCSGHDDLVMRSGVVPLRWGTPRLLLVTPSQWRLISKGEGVVPKDKYGNELFRTWQLWRYAFCFSTDAVIVGSPKKTAKLIQENIKKGLDWHEGIDKSIIDEV